MISNEIGHCLNALGIVEKEQRHCAWAVKMQNVK
jgi:hypothetical protein